MAKNANEVKFARPWRESRNRHKGGADYASLNAEALLKHLARCAARGMAIRFGYTRDGGAFAIGVYGDGSEAYTEIVGPSDDPVEILQSLADYYEHEPLKPS